MRLTYRKRPMKRKPKTFSQILMLTLVSFFVSIIFSVWIINKGIEPTLIDIAERLTGQYAREAINEAVSKRIVQQLDVDELIQVEKNEDGNIVSMGWNSVVVNTVIRNATFRVQNYLKRLERGERPIGDSLDFDLDEEEQIIEEDETVNNEALVEIPIGQATGNALLANLGPKVPVHFSVIGEVQPDFITDVQEYGINNAMINIEIEVKVNVQIVIPFSTKTTEVVTRIPVDTRVIQGLVPNFYSNGGNGADISIPYSESQKRSLQE
ncbi:sporulation protein YunB [Filobacillus milosensis]|uniref:Sporulation protein YunB n=1 Tax=Filobacillus milosensis TaxID=94137 RepID=A0A4Y8IT92_9BACI|nr:sporulation protein YunB [Filobacillus milosensis]TFB24269.1 sporulation protein YunB [Filobacillus milosensis]